MTEKLKNAQKALVSLTFLTCVLTSCKDKEPLGMRFNNATEKKVINKVIQLSDVAAALWPGYNLPKTHPLFLVFPNESGEDTYGYIMNVDVPPMGSRLVSEELILNTTIYRNDELVEIAKNRFSGKIPLFSFDFEVEGISFFLTKHLMTTSNAYLNFKNADDNNLALLITHELFHRYQFEVDQWNLNLFRQDYNGYPQTKEIISLSLLLSDIASEAYSGVNKLQFLEQYVSIRKKQIELDPSAKQLVLFQTTYTESVEGSARYIEHFGALTSIYPRINSDPTHSFGAQLDTVSTELLARQILVQRIPYHTGAIVIKLLLESNVNVALGLKEGKTPYEMTMKFLGKTDSDYNTTLSQLQKAVNWPSYQRRAEFLESILD